MSYAQLPRVMIAGLSGDAGKTLVALGLIGAFRNKNLRVAPFKKGPDFIDAGWLGAAAGTSGRNLDTFLMPASAIWASLGNAAKTADIAVVEGNRGLFDGADVHGTHSTAELTKLIGAPLILILDATKATRTLAALILGCRAMDPSLHIAAVVLNRIGTARQEALIRKAVGEVSDIPVIGAIPKLQNTDLPTRHLGLVTSMEHIDTSGAVSRAAEIIEKHIDIDAALDTAKLAADFNAPQAGSSIPTSRVRIGVLKDRAFSFYYPENIEALVAEGAKIVYISPLLDSEMPDIDALYAGGGFPEEFARELSNNRRFREILNTRITEGLPVWAECGGLMYLSNAISRDSITYPMVGAIPVEVKHQSRPQGHGYVTARVDTKNPFLCRGERFTGHEFHYSGLRSRQETAQLKTVMALERGVGVGAGRDGIRAGNVVATYTHLHSLGVPAWAPAVVRAAEGRAPL